MRDFVFALEKGTTKKENKQTLVKRALTTENRKKPSKCGEWKDCDIVCHANKADQPESEREILRIGYIDHFVSACCLFFQNSFSPFIEECQNDRTDQGKDTSDGCQKECYAKTGMVFKIISDLIIDTDHCDKVCCTANTSNTQLQTKDHVQFFIFKPTDSVCVLCHSQRFSANAKTIF